MDDVLWCLVTVGRKPENSGTVQVIVFTDYAQARKAELRRRKQFPAPKFTHHVRRAFTAPAPAPNDDWSVKR